MAEPPSRQGPDPTYSEIDVEPGIWLARRLLTEGGVTITTLATLQGRMQPVAETFVSLDADVVTRFVEAAARREELVARHFERTERTLKRLSDLRVAMRMSGLLAALGGYLSAALPAQEILAASLSADLATVASLGVGAGGGTVALLLTRRLLAWLVRRRIGRLEVVVRKLARQPTGKRAF